MSVCNFESNTMQLCRNSLHQRG